MKRPKDTRPKETSRKRRALATAQSSDGLDALAAGIAHDFNNLLTVIRGCAELLGADASDEQRQCVDELIAATERATNLTAQLETFGRDPVMRPEPVRPDELVRGLADTLRRLMPENVELRVSARMVNGVMLVDASRLRQAVTTLVLYAAEIARRPGRVWLSAAEEQVESGTDDATWMKPGRYAVITVAAMADALASRAHTGVLGGDTASVPDVRLASVAKFVNASGAFADIATQPGRGTKLRLCLSITDDAPRPAHGGGRRALKLEDEDARGDEIVLVVEDDHDVRRTVRAGLERYGFTVFEAEDGASALHVIDMLEGQVDLLLTDLMMPEMAGRELVEELQVGQRLPPVLLMSGYTDRRGLPGPDFAFIQKPFTPRELARAVRRVLDTGAD